MQVFQKCQTFLEPAQAFKRALFAEKLNGIKMLTFFGKKLLKDVKCLTRF